MREIRSEGLTEGKYSAVNSILVFNTEQFKLLPERHMVTPDLSEYASHGALIKLEERKLFLLLEKKIIT